MSAEKLALPVTAKTLNSALAAELFDADGSHIGSVTTYAPTIPPEVAQRAAEAAAAVINEAMTPAWTWGSSSSHVTHRYLYYKGRYSDTVSASDAMAQAMCDVLNAAGVEP